MDREQVLRSAYSPRTSADPAFVRDTIGVALFGAAQEQVAARGGRPTLPAPGVAPLTSGAPPPPPNAVPLAAPQPQTSPPANVIPSPLTVNPTEVIASLPDTAPDIDDFTRHGTLPGYGDAALDPFGSALRRRLTVLLRSM